MTESREPRKVRDTPSIHYVLRLTFGVLIVAWVLLFVDLVAQGRWLDVFLLIVASIAVVVAYVIQRQARPFTG
jgi:hypothetical protein